MIVIWCILMESFQVTTVASGILIGVFSVYFSERYITGFNYGRRYPISVFGMIYYVGFLVVEILKSGFSALRLLVLGRSNPKIVTVTTQLKTALCITLLANSVTLTPGTVTVDVEGKDLKILWLEGKPITGEALKRELIGALEDKLLKLEERL